MNIIFRIILGIFIVLIFPGIGAGVYYKMIRPPLIAGNIIKNGIETTAKLASVESRLTKSSNGAKENYYSFTIIFKNLNGEDITVKTNSIYSERFIREQNICSYNSITRKYDIIVKENILIKYHGNNAVVKGYTPEEADNVLWIFIIIFVLIGVLLFIVVMVGINNDKSDAKIKQFGTSGTGKYLRHTKDLVNGVILYKIYYSFENDRGDIIETKTILADRNLEAETIIQMQLFPIKYIGNKAYIMIDKN